MILRLGSTDTVAEFGRFADDKRDFQFEIQQFGCTECWNFRIGRFQLSFRAVQGRSADHDTRGAAVIAYRDMFPVRQQRIGGIAEHFTHVRGVIDAGIKIGVVADAHREQHLHVALQQQALFPRFFL
ncbi:MAG: hypothetical protein FD123_1747 [Bacteroidetes bacterium]|nr:MAG: hypothetical protein FD123_1747 [Bacteroidota bacterium]